jgi:hypothetical protein
MKLGLEETPRSLVFEHWSLQTRTLNRVDRFLLCVQFVAFLTAIRLTADISLFDVLGWRLGYGGKRMLRSKSNYRAVR